MSKAVMDMLNQGFRSFFGEKDPVPINANRARRKLLMRSGMPNVLIVWSSVRPSRHGRSDPPFGGASRRG